MELLLEKSVLKTMHFDNTAMYALHVPAHRAHIVSDLHSNRPLGLPKPATKSVVRANTDLNPTTKTCLRCGKPFTDQDNGPKACAYHGHMTGERGLFAMAPPHQGIDGEWTDESGVIVYRWNDAENRPNTGRKNWKSRWTCCGVYERDAPPCRHGWHASYDDGATLF